MGMTSVANGIIKPLNKSKKKVSFKGKRNFANTYPRRELENIEIRVIPPETITLFTKYRPNGSLWNRVMSL